MALLPFAGVCLATFLVLQFWSIRRLRRAIREEPTADVLPRAAKLALLRYVRAVVLLALFTSLSVATGVFALRTQGSPLAKTPAVRAAMDRVHDARRSLDALYPYWFGTAGLLVTIGLAIYTYRRRHIQCSAAFQAAAQAEYDRLFQAMQTDPSWWDLPPNPQMAHVWAEHERVKQRIPDLPEDIRPAAQERLEQLRRLFMDLDITRRMDVRLDPDAVEDPAPETWREWLACLIGGRRLLGSVGLGTRLLYRASLVLMILGMIGFSASGVYQALDDRLVGLQDLKIRIQRLETLEDRIARFEDEPIPQSDQSNRSSPLSQGMRFASRIGDVSRHAVQVQNELTQANASRASYQPVDEKIQDLQAAVKEATVRDQQQRDLMEEIRKATDESPAEARKSGTPGAQEREQVANLSERVAREAADVDGPGGRVRERAVEMNRRLADLDPDRRLSPVREELTGVEKQLGDLSASRAKAEQALEDEVNGIGKLRGREAEQAALRQRIAELRANARAQLAEAAERVKAARSGYEGGLSSGQAEFAPRREQVWAMKERVDELSATSMRRPAELHASRLRLDAAEARFDWESARAAERAPAQELTALEKDGAQRIARAYEINAGEALAKSGLIPEPELKAATELRGMATRDAILKRAQAVAPTERVRPPTLADSPTLSAAEKSIARSAEAVFQPDVPRTWAGKAMEETVLAEARNSPSLRRALASAARSVNQRLRSVPGRPFVRELALDALDVVGRPIAGDMADVVAQVSRDTIAQYEKAARYRFVREIAAGERGLETAMTRVRGLNPEVTLGGTARDYIRRVSVKPPDVSAVTKSLRPFEPAIDVPFEPGVKLEKASALIRQEAARGTAELRAYRASVMSESLYNYSDPFPSQPGMDRLTPRGQILESVEDTAGAVRTAEAKGLASWRATGRASTSATLRPVEVAPFARERLAIPGPRSSLSAPVEAAGARARAFRSLISSPRIGGILIGREPAAAPAARALDLTQLRWEIDGQNVRLIIADRESRVHRSRLFRRDLVELAVVYAADGRPITVTIINTRPLAERRVLLHPTLVDTALGRSVIRADMIIFNLISNEAWYKDAHQSVLNQIELYRRAWAARQLAMGDLEVLKPEYCAYLKQSLDGAPSEPATAALHDPDAMRDPRRSLVTAKPEYFDPELVKWIIADSGPKRALDGFDASIRERAVHELNETRRWLKSREADERAMNLQVESFNEKAKSGGFNSQAEFELERQRLIKQGEQYDTRAKAEGERLNQLFRRWTAPVPEIQPVSSIRERAFETTLADCFVADGTAAPPAVDFLIQVTFESAPYFLNGLPPDFEDKTAHNALAAYNDPKPWEFPAIAGRVREVVQAALDQKPEMAEDRQAISALSEFTLLQRLFRLALGGQLGRDFPIETLAELHFEVAPTTPAAPVRTLRWDSRPGLLEQFLGKLVDSSLTSLNGKDGLETAPLRIALDAIRSLTAEYESKDAEREKQLAAIETSHGTQGEWDAAWEAFQSWDRDWEARLEKAADALALACKPAGTGLAVVAPRVPRKEAPESQPADLAEAFHGLTHAIALRRALDVAADDRQTRLERGRSQATGASQIAGAGR
jgi:hypothetical protein